MLRRSFVPKFHRPPAATKGSRCRQGSTTAGLIDLLQRDTGGRALAVSHVEAESHETYVHISCGTRVVSTGSLVKLGSPCIEQAGRDGGRACRNALDNRTLSILSTVVVATRASMDHKFMSVVNAA